MLENNNQINIENQEADIINNIEKQEANIINNIEKQETNSYFNIFDFENFILTLKKYGIYILIILLILFILLYKGLIYFNKINNKIEVNNIRTEIQKPITEKKDDIKKVIGKKTFNIIINDTIDSYGYKAKPRVVLNKISINFTNTNIDENICLKNIYIINGKGESNLSCWYSYGGGGDDGIYDGVQSVTTKTITEIKNVNNLLTEPIDIKSPALLSINIPFELDENIKTDYNIKYELINLDTNEKINKEYNGNITLESNDFDLNNIRSNINYDIYHLSPIKVPYSLNMKKLNDFKLKGDDVELICTPKINDSNLLYGENEIFVDIGFGIYGELSYEDLGEEIFNIPIFNKIKEDIKTLSYNKHVSLGEDHKTEDKNIQNSQQHILHDFLIGSLVLNDKENKKYYLLIKPYYNRGFIDEIYYNFFSKSGDVTSIDEMHGVTNDLGYGIAKDKNYEDCKNKSGLIYNKIELSEFEFNKFIEILNKNKQNITDDTMLSGNKVLDYSKFDKETWSVSYNNNKLYLKDNNDSMDIIDIKFNEESIDFISDDFNKFTNLLDYKNINNELFWNISFISKATHEGIKITYNTNLNTGITSELFNERVD